MALSKDTGMTYESGIEPIFNDHALDSTGTFTIFEGAVVGLSPTDNTAGPFALADNFAGFAMGKAIRGTHSHVKVRSQGIVKLTVAVTGAGALDVGDGVYATDDGTFTMDANDGSGTDYMQIGKVHRLESHGASTAVALVFFQAASLRSV